MSKLKAGEAVTILSSFDTNKQNLEAARNAVIDLGGVLTVLELPPTNGDIALSRDKVAFIGKTALQGNKAAMAALKQSDLVIDLMLLLFSPEQAEILSGGTRMLLAVEPPEVLLRLKPTVEDQPPRTGRRRAPSWQRQKDDGHLQGRHRTSTATSANFQSSPSTVLPMNPAAGIIGRADFL